MAPVVAPVSAATSVAGTEAPPRPEVAREYSPWGLAPPAPAPIE